VLNTNPRQRYAIDDIKCHPWFNILKPSLSQGFIVGKTEFPIEENILTLLKAYNINSEELMIALSNNRHTHATTSYYLLHKKTSKSIKSNSKII
jgi:5'-AMP-activated protein kinase, catalytic alpha subunit